MPSGRTTGVQFRGVTNVVRAYHNMHITNWGIFCGSDLIEAYEGDDFDEGEELLKKFLDELSIGRSNSYYTLCVYDETDFPKNKKIRAKTEYTRAFKFTLFEEFQSSPETQSFYRSMNDRLERIEAKQSLDDKPEGEDHHEGGIAGFLSGLMEDPAVKQAIGNAISYGISKIVDFFKPMPETNVYNQTQIAPASIGAINETEQLKLIEQSVQELYQIDKELGTHLSAIARIAKQNPAKYNQLLGFLKMM